MTSAFGHLKLKDLRRRNVEGYLTDLRKTHSPASVNRYLTLLSAIFRRAIALLRHAPVSGLPRVCSPALKEPGFFMRAHVAHGTVAWSDDIDLSPDTLYLRGVTSGRPQR